MWNEEDIWENVSDFENCFGSLLAYVTETRNHVSTFFQQIGENFSGEIISKLRRGNNFHRQRERIMYK